MKIPSITHLQFLILSMLMNGELSGRELRDGLKKFKQKKSLAAFYQMMARMEEAKLVSGCYEPLVIDGHRVKERRYTILAQGVSNWEQTRDYYAEVISNSDRQLGWV